MFLTEQGKNFISSFLEFRDVYCRIKYGMDIILAGNVTETLMQMGHFGNMVNANGNKFQMRQWEALRWVLEVFLEMIKLK